MTNHTLLKAVFQTGVLLAATAVALGAFAAHSLKDSLSDGDLRIFETGVRYQFIHAGAILFLAAFIRRLHQKVMIQAFTLFWLGILIFSGSLYLLATHNLWTTTNVKWIGLFTPVGGLFFIAGWILLAAKGYKVTDGSHYVASSSLEENELENTKSRSKTKSRTKDN
jgi:uncharacterized membrane protein YgdD (TMEM256/DUF423 family)